MSKLLCNVLKISRGGKCPKCPPLVARLTRTFILHPLQSFSASERRYLWTIEQLALSLNVQYKRLYILYVWANRAISLLRFAYKKQINRLCSKEMYSSVHWNTVDDVLIQVSCYFSWYHTHRAWKLKVGRPSNGA